MQDIKLIVEKNINKLNRVHSYVNIFDYDLDTHYAL